MAYYLTEVKFCKVKPEDMGITRIRACVRWGLGVNILENKIWDSLVTNTLYK
jgi:hypothetical protein